MGPWSIDMYIYIYIIISIFYSVARSVHHLRSSWEHLATLAEAYIKTHLKYHCDADNCRAAPYFQCVSASWLKWSSYAICWRGRPSPKLSFIQRNRTCSLPLSVVKQNCEWNKSGHTQLGAKSDSPPLRRAQVTWHQRCPLMDILHLRSFTWRVGTYSSSIMRTVCISDVGMLLSLASSLC